MNALVFYANWDFRSSPFFFLFISISVAYHKESMAKNCLNYRKNNEQKSWFQ